MSHPAASYDPQHAEVIKSFEPYNSIPYAWMMQEEEAQKHRKLKYKCRCSFLEIYNEQISDLLEPSLTNLQMREDLNKGVYVEGLLEVEVQNVQDVLHLLLLVRAHDFN